MDSLAAKPESALQHSLVLLSDSSQQQIFRLHSNIAGLIHLSSIFGKLIAAHNTKLTGITPPTWADRKISPHPTKRRWLVIPISPPPPGQHHLHHHLQPPSPFLISLMPPFLRINPTTASTRATATLPQSPSPHLSAKMPRPCTPSSPSKPSSRRDRT